MFCVVKDSAAIGDTIAKSQITKENRTWCLFTYVRFALSGDPFRFRKITHKGTIELSISAMTGDWTEALTGQCNWELNLSLEALMSEYKYIHVLVGGSAFLGGGITKTNENPRTEACIKGNRQERA